MEASAESQDALVELQTIDSTMDRLVHRRDNLPEDAQLVRIDASLEVVDQLAAERDGTLVTVRREIGRLEGEVDMVRRKGESEEARAASGKVSSPKELTAIQDEVAALKRRQTTLEDDLLELMETAETLEAELGELTRQGDDGRREQQDVTAARDDALAEIAVELERERDARERCAPNVDTELLELYDQLRAKLGGVGAAELVGNTCQGCRVAMSAVELAAIRKLPPEVVKRCEQCGRILVVRR